MAKNRLSDLNNHLFAQIERLGDESLKGDKLVEEINRSWAVSRISQQIIKNADLVLRAQVAVEKDMLGMAKLPSILVDEEPRQ